MEKLPLTASLCALLFSSIVHAETKFSESDQGSDFSMMQELSDHGWHDLKDESWNLYGQGTYISTFKQRFNPLYTNLNGSTNSLTPIGEHSFTATFTLFLGLKFWEGGEFYAVPEMISLRPLSDLKGLGAGIQDFELQKNGTMDPLWYLPRGFFRQTIDLGGSNVELPSGPMQLGSTTKSRRFVATAGIISILDTFDRNSYAAELRQQFLNMSFMTYGAYDFSSDARGYSAGVVGELYWDDWALRFGRLNTPKHPNQLKLDYGLRYYGDQVELEHKHQILDRPGAVKVLGYRNHQQMGSWTAAMNQYNSDPVAYNAAACGNSDVLFNYGSGNTNAPDLCWVRKGREKVGIGLNLEQQLTDDIGVFFRGMYSDGRTEVYAYMSADRSISMGGIIKGERWGRSKDAIGIGFSESWISKLHAEYLNMGGIDGFIGDGKLNQAPEKVAEIYYKLHLYTSTWLTADYQRISNPAYNADRGDVNIYGVRAHFEF